MQLIVPYLEELDAVDARLISLAEFLGIKCETLSLDRDVRDPAEPLEKAVSDRHVCFVVDPRVLQRWIGGG